MKKNMKITIHTWAAPNTFIQSILRGVKKHVAPRGKLLIANDSPLASPEHFEQTPARFLEVFYARVLAAPVRTAVELGCLDNSFLPNAPGTISLAVDQREDGLKLVRRRYPHVTAIRANIRALPLANESCDLVFWNKEMLHFLGEYADEATPYSQELLTGNAETDVDKALKSIYRILKPGGYFVENRPMRDTWGLPLRFKKIGARFKALHYILLGDQNLAAMFFVK